MSYIEQATDYAQSLYRNLRQRYSDLSFEGKVSSPTAVPGQAGTILG